MRRITSFPVVLVAGFFLGGGLTPQCHVIAAVTNSTANSASAKTAVKATPALPSTATPAQSAAPAATMPPASPATKNSDRIYGRIATSDGHTYEGFIRWDKNEAHWFDILNGTKQLDRRQQRELRRKAREVSRHSNDENGSGDWVFSFNSSAESGIRFGNLSKLDVEGDDEAILTMKNGETVHYEGGSTDIGTDMRELLIEDKSEGEIELGWDDLETVTFLPSPPDAPCRWGDRLYGTVTTRRGQQLTGQITWDIDEVFSDDLLEGEDRDRSRKFRFDRITKITRYSSSASVVTLKNGEEITLRGSNDVDDSNRGIIVADPGLGDQRIEWSNFESLELKEPHPGPVYASFQPPKRLHGTVTTADGGSYTGDIRWDNDETWTWEMLNGSTRDVSYDIEFGNIASIERHALRSVTVTLKSGRSLELRGSNDVDDSNKGIIVQGAGGRDEVINWEDFEKVVFDR